MNARGRGYWRRLWIVLALGALSACGFQLQGRQVLPATLATVVIDAKDEQSEFMHALRAAINASGGRVAAEGTVGAATLRIRRDEVIERVLSVDSRNIPTDYELTYDVEIDVTADGRQLLDSEEFSRSIVYSFDETKLLAKEREKEILVEALARDMASVVTRRLSSL